MKFYRLETTDKIGIYCALFGGAIDKYFEAGRHPMPSNDSLLIKNLGRTDICPNYIFGFKSFEQYRSWFFNDADLLEFQAEGIRLNLYETGDYFVGNAQIVANKQNSLDFISECNILTGEPLLR